MAEITEVSPHYISEHFKVPPIQVYRLDTGRGRWYYTFHQGEPRFYQSVTSFIKNSLPMSEHLIKWRCDLGWDKSNAYMFERACYGTLMHTLIAKFVQNGSLHKDVISECVDLSLTSNRLDINFKREWIEELFKDLLAFAQFVFDYEVEFLGLEITLVSEKYGIAGTLDAPCILNDKLYTDKTAKEKRKRVTANIDFKSGRKNFYESHEIQLEACRMLWDENFPDTRLDKIFNWAPKEWKKEPGYSLKDQTEALSIEKLKHFIAIAEIEGRHRLPNVFTPNDEITLGQSPENCFKSIHISEIVKQKYGAKIS